MHLLCFLNNCGQDDLIDDRSLPVGIFLSIMHYKEHLTKSSLSHLLTCKMAMEVVKEFLNYLRVTRLVAAIILGYTLGFDILKAENSLRRETDR